jgi:hypothetical protein
MPCTTIKRTLAAALTGATLAGAAAAPIASAMPADPVRMPAATGTREVIVPAPAVRAEAPPADGFDLAAAGLGAAGSGLVAVLVVGGLAWRRPRRHGEAVVGG